MKKRDQNRLRMTLTTLLSYVTVDSFQYKLTELYRLAQVEPVQDLAAISAILNLAEVKTSVGSWLVSAIDQDTIQFSRVSHVVVSMTEKRKTISSRQQGKQLLRLSPITNLMLTEAIYKAAS